mgnify:CR=1 FL=1
MNTGLEGPDHLQDLADARRRLREVENRLTQYYTVEAAEQGIGDALSHVNEALARVGVRPGAVRDEAPRGQTHLHLNRTSLREGLRMSILLGKPRSLDPLE